MRRADRLFQLVQLVRGRRLSTGEWLAGRLQVSLRTVYRDVADLQAQGVPLEGEAGVGYRLRAGFDLPPLMFSIGEAKALVAELPRLAASVVALRIATRQDGGAWPEAAALFPAWEQAIAAFPEATLMRLEVEPGNQGAIAFYEARGFRPAGRAGDCGGSGDGIAALMMERPVKA